MAPEKFCKGTRQRRNDTLVNGARWPSSKARGRISAMSEQKIEFTLNGKETEVSYESGDSLLDTAIRQGLNPPYSCMEGMCTACIAKLTEGELDFPEDTILDESEVRAGKILTCQATVKKGCVLVKVNYDNLG